MRLPVRPMLACAVLLLSGPSASHAQLWRNGEFDGFGGLASVHSADLTGRTYDNFIVSGLGWQITSLYGEFITDFQPQEAFWEIRSGITEGLGGTVLYQGISLVTGLDDVGDFGGFDILALKFADIDPFALGPGEYWLTIALMGDNGLAFVGTTDGTNGINSVGDARVYFDAPDLGYHFNGEPVDFRSDFAYGLDGVEFSTVPEPATVLLVGTGLGVLALAARRRRNSA